MKKLFLISFFCSQFLLGKSETTEMIFQGVKYYQKDFESLNPEPKYANMTIKISFSSSSTLNALVKFNNDGSIIFVGTDDNPILNIDRGQCAGCGKYCASCKSSLGAVLCYLGCCFGIVKSDNTDLSSLQFDSKSLQIHNIDYAFSFRNNMEMPQNECMIELYNQDETLNSHSLIGYDNDGNLSILAYGKEVEISRAKSAFGKCLEDCGKGSMSNVSAWFCLWDCIYEATKKIDTNFNSQ